MHSEEVEGCRSLYAQSVALIATDLTQRVFQIRVCEAGRYHNHPWISYLGEHLAKFASEVRGLLVIPQIWQAVDDWLDGSLEIMQPMTRPRYQELQRAFQDGLVEKLDEAFIAGDPFLAAVTVVRYPERIKRLCKLADLEDTKSDDVVRELQKRSWAVIERIEGEFPRSFDGTGATGTKPQFLQSIACKVKNED